MGPKLLFVMGIVAAHGALGAAWLRQDVPQPRASLATCVNAPSPLPYIQPQRELLAYVVSPRANPLQP